MEKYLFKEFKNLKVFTADNNYYRYFTTSDAHATRFGVKNEKHEESIEVIHINSNNSSIVAFNSPKNRYHTPPLIQTLNDQRTSFNVENDDELHVSFSLGDNCFSLFIGDGDDFVSIKNGEDTHFSILRKFAKLDYQVTYDFVCSGEVFFSKRVDYDLVDNHPCKINVYPFDINLEPGFNTYNHLYSSRAPFLPVLLQRDKTGNVSGIGALLSSSACEEYLATTSVKTSAHRSGYAILPRANDNDSYMMGFYEGSTNSFEGPCINKNKSDTYCGIYENGKSQGYIFYNDGTTDEYYVYYSANGVTEGLAFKIKLNKYIEVLLYRGGNLERTIAKIDLKSFGIHDYESKETYPHYYLTDTPIEEEEEEEILEEEEEIIEEEPVEEEEKPSKIEEIKPKVEDFIKDTSSHIASFFSSIGKSISKGFFKCTSAIWDWMGDVWYAITSFFGSIFGTRNRYRSSYGRSNPFVTFFKGLGSGILKVLGFIVSLPLLLFKGLGKFCGAVVKDFSLGTITSVLLPILSAGFMLLAIFDCITPISNWCSDVVSVHIFSWMGLHLCTLFLNAVGVNFFSVVAVIFIFIIDALYNILLIVFELICIILYCILFFAGFYGIGVVALVLYIISFVTSEDGKALVGGSFVLTAGLLVVYYIFMIQTLMGVYGAR